MTLDTCPETMRCAGVAAKRPMLARFTVDGINVLAYDLPHAVKLVRGVQ